MIILNSRDETEKFITLNGRSSRKQRSTHYRIALKASSTTGISNLHDGNQDSGQLWVGAVVRD